KRQTRRWDFGGSGLIEWRRLKPLKANRPLVQVVRVSGDRVFRKVYQRKAFERSDGKLVLKRPATVSGDRTIAIFTSTTPIATDPFPYSYNIVR
ncbi:MAG TPA: hypothetical protein VFS18_02080, partial [Actinomycetota bacterium]|nr:hypothetical protein [Actinomycetota bacterium]